MTKKTRRSKERAQAQQPRKQRPQDWSAEQKLRVVVQAMSLNEEELGVLLRKEKALAEAAALLILKKKVQTIWGDEDDDTNPRSGR
jgi:hypothetical protein